MKIKFKDGIEKEFTYLCGAHLHGADLDYSCWPLWCGSLSPKIDKRLACQLLYHTMMAMQGCDDLEVKEFLGNNQAIALANKFHRTDEYGEKKDELPKEN